LVGGGDGGEVIKDLLGLGKLALFAHLGGEAEVGDEQEREEAVAVGFEEGFDLVAGFAPLGLAQEVACALLGGERGG
jgi:hypothetical protein